MINLLIIEGGSGYGGSSSALVNFLKYINRIKFDVRVVVFDHAYGPNILKIKNLGIPLIVISTGVLKKFFFCEVVTRLPRFIRYIIRGLHLIIVDIPVALRIAWIIRRNKVRFVFVS